MLPFYRGKEYIKMTWPRITKQFNQKKNFSLNSYPFIANTAYLLSITFFAEIKKKQKNSILSMKIGKIDDNR